MIGEVKVGDIVWTIYNEHPTPFFVLTVCSPTETCPKEILLSDKRGSDACIQSTRFDKNLYHSFSELLLDKWKPLVYSDESDQELMDAVSRAYNSGVGSVKPAQPDRDFEMLLGMLCAPRNAKYFQGDPDILRIAHEAMRGFRKNYPDHSSFFDECDPQIQQKNEPPDPVHCDGDKWYFWDETWADRHGPYDTNDEAQYKLQKYINEVLGPPDEEKLAELFDKYRQSVKSVLMSDPLLARDETADLPSVTFAEVMARATSAVKKFSDVMGSVKNPCAEMLESTPPDTDSNEFATALKPNGLAQRDCPDEATECFQCNLINLSPLSPDVIKKWATGACVCKHVITFHDATPEETAKRDTAFDKEQEEMRAAKDDSFIMPMSPLVEINITDEMRKSVKKGLLKRWGQESEVKPQCDAQSSRDEVPSCDEQDQDVGPRESFLTEEEEANFPSEPFLTKKEAKKMWDEAGGCDCGGPADHLPGGSHCRKPL